MSRTTSVLVTAALVALGAGALAGPAAAREGRRGIAVGEYHPGGRHHGHGGWHHGGWHHRRHVGFGFYPAPVYVGGFAAGGDCYPVARRRFIPGYGYAKRVDRVCNGDRLY
jgi:hypothetical protein